MAGKAQSKFPLPIGEEVAVRLGDSFKKSSATAYHKVRYDFKPASFSSRKPGSVEVGSGRDVKMKFTNPQSEYAGSTQPTSKDCVLIFEPDGSVVLEQVWSHVHVKKQRGSSHSGRDLSTVDDSGFTMGGDDFDEAPPPKRSKQPDRVVQQESSDDDDETAAVSFVEVGRGGARAAAVPANPITLKRNNEPIIGGNQPQRRLSSSGSNSSSSSSDDSNSSSSDSSDSDSSDSDNSSDSELEKKLNKAAGIPANPDLLKQPSSSGSLQGDLALSDSDGDDD